MKACTFISQENMCRCVSRDHTQTHKLNKPILASRILKVFCACVRELVLLIILFKTHTRMTSLSHMLPPSLTHTYTYARTHTRTPHVRMHTHRTHTAGGRTQNHRKRCSSGKCAVGCAQGGCAQNLPAVRGRTS